MSDNTNPYVETIGNPQAPLSTIRREVNSVTMDDEEDGVNIRDYFVRCIVRWRWFAAAIVACLAIAAVYIAVTPKTYSRSASVIVEDDDASANSVASSLSSLGLFSTSTNVANELLAFSSPALVSDVVTKLGLQTDYTYRKFLRPITLYGSTSVILASFSSLKPDVEMTADVVILPDNKVEVSHISDGEEDVSGKFKVAFGDTLKTELGNIVFFKGPAYDPKFDYTINVKHMPLVPTVLGYNEKLRISLADEDATVIDFTMDDQNKQRIEDFINALIDVYNANWRRDKEKMAVATSNFINDRLEVIEKELGGVDSDIAKYKGENLLPDVKAASEMFLEDASENMKRKTEVGTQLEILKYLAEFMRDAANAGKLLPANTGIESPGITEQIISYNTKLLERDRIIAATGANSPMLTNVDETLERMKSALESSLGNQVKALTTELNAINASDRATEQKIASSPSQAKYLLSVERQQKVKESLYLYLLEKREENELSLAFTPSNIRVITPPWGKNTPSAPLTRQILMVAFFAGILIPAIIIFIGETINTRVRTREDLAALKAPFIGEIPDAGGRKSAWRNWTRRWRDIIGQESKVEDPPKLLVRNHGRSVVNESFRMVRSNLEFITRSGNNKVVMLTSFNPGSGKSFVSVNLAAAMAVKRKGSRILVVDMDLRRASLSRMVGSHLRGISDYLSEGVSDVKALVKPTECEGLSILPAGTIPPNPSELLYSSRLAKAIAELREDYDCIFLDCPPADIVADTTIITPLADITIFVLRAGLMDRRLLPDINYMYDTHRFNNMLVLLNGTTSAGVSYRRYAYSGYYSNKE
ncbi:MAG: polysaccharide biosynthesis tyrosine autokinase [Muribaculaceae bacterium]|nr:polysaccharide biosynthesis tyrosine autokinase [Muribaculaceae bacterium]